jgi:tRNA threonylcarbamoyladenosine dehydratase
MKDFSWLSRTQLLVKEEGLEILSQKHVLIIGMGGVGSFAAEFIARSGIGTMTIVDGDTVDISNCNRQLPALRTTVGKYKTDIMEERILSINPEIQLNKITEFLSPERMEELLSAQKYDYVMDCIDSVTPKLILIQTALKHQIPLISSMGAGGRYDPTQLKVADVSKSYNCPLAHYVRKRLRHLGIKKGFKVVFSSELPDKDSIMTTDGSNYKRSAYGTMAWLPAAFGGTCASVVVRDILGKND